MKSKINKNKYGIFVFFSLTIGLVFEKEVSNPSNHPSEKPFFLLYSNQAGCTSVCVLKGRKKFFSRWIWMLLYVSRFSHVMQHRNIECVYTLFSEASMREKQHAWKD